MIFTKESLNRHRTASPKVFSSDIFSTIGNDDCESVLVKQKGAHHSAPSSSFL